MISAAPHYLLLCEAKSKSAENSHGGQWTFVLEQVGTSHRIEVAECEPDTKGERLQLLAVVRGLEALEQPSRVTSFTSSRYVGHGVRSHLAAWRENGFRWERFGEMRSIKHRDLWIRVSRAMNFHQVDCRVWQFETAASIGSTFAAASGYEVAPSVSEYSSADPSLTVSTIENLSTIGATRKKSTRGPQLMAERWGDRKIRIRRKGLECAAS